METLADNKKVFVDTNILIFANVRSSPFYEQSQAKLIDLYENDYELCISSQVLREYLAVLSRPDALGKKIADELLIADINNFRLEYTILFENHQSLDNLQKMLSACPTGGKQIHDANIVATMLAHDVKVILTHNRKDFVRFEDFVSIIGI